MDSNKLRLTILASMADLVTDLLVEDRLDDQDLPRGAIEDAVDSGVVDVGEMLEVFADELGTQLGMLIYIDVLCGSKHRYYSTHCRHGDHNACSATSVAGVDAEEPRILHAIERKPAQCKHCGAPCCCEECKANGKH
jgi:hypothetical protein